MHPSDKPEDAMSQFSTSYVTSKDVFASIFAPSSPDALLLCFEGAHDRATSDGLRCFENKVKNCVKQLTVRLALYLWDCTSSAFADAKLLLDKKRGCPLLLIVYRGQVADMVRTVTLEQMASHYIAPICERMAFFQQQPHSVAQWVSTEHIGERAEGGEHGAAAASSAIMNVLAIKPTLESGLNSSTDRIRTQDAAQTTRGEPQAQMLRVDVARMMHIGQGLLAKSHAVYAEKVFAKAVSVLDVMYKDIVTEGKAEHTVHVDSYARSLALALAYAGLSQLVQGKDVQQNTFLTRLHQCNDAGVAGPSTTGALCLQSYCDEPLSDVNRACTLQTLMTALDEGATWTAETASLKRLTTVLRDTPHNDAARAMLVITLFLRGDVERAMTEAVKLREVRGSDFGRVAVEALSHFLGKDHEVVRQVQIIPERAGGTKVSH